MLNKNYKKVLILIACLGVLIVGILFFINYWRSGVLIIDVDPADSTIKIVPNDGEEIEVKGSTTQRLKSGEYTVKAIGVNGGISDTKVTVKARQDTTISLKVSPTKQGRLISNTPVSSLSLTNSSIYFSQPEIGILKKYDINSLEIRAVETKNSNEPNLEKISKVQIDNNDEGYISTLDGLLYRYDKNRITNIRETLLGNIKSFGLPRRFDYETSSKQVVLSGNNKAYVASWEDSKAKFVYETDWPIGNVSHSGKDWIFLGETDPPADESEDKKEEIGSNKTVQLYNIKTKDTIYLEDNSIAKDSVWSPDGRYVSYALSGQVKVFDTEKQVQASSYRTAVDRKVSLSWCDSQRLIIGDSEGVWVADSSSEKNDRNYLSKIGDVYDVECTDSGVYVGAYIYPRTGGLYYVPFEDDDSDLYSALNSSLPYNSVGYSIEYSSGDGKPQVNVFILVPRDISYKKPGQKGYLAHKIFMEQKTKSAKQFLEDNGIDISKVELKVAERST